MNFDLPTSPDIIYSFFNENIYEEVKRNSDTIKYYFNTKLPGNQLVQRVVDSIVEYPFESIDEPLYNTLLADLGKTNGERAEIIGKIKYWKGLDREKVLPTLNFIRNVCAASILWRAQSIYGDNPVEILKYIKETEYSPGSINMLTSKKFSEIDIKKIVEESNNSAIPSCYQWINNSFKPRGGYERGQMVLVTAAPGVGKSLFLMSEAIHMAIGGEKVLYIGLGDNTEKDFVIRMGAIFSGKSFAEVHMDTLNVYNSFLAAVEDRLEISINPAGTISADDIVEIAKKRPDLGVIIVDYDGNLAGVNEGESMYNTFGSVYVKLNEVVLMGKLLLMAAQPKVSAWKSSIIEMSDIGESSRKQHTADVIIGIGQETSSPYHAHAFKISKSRRGEEGIISYSARLNNGRFITVNKEIYELLRTGQLNGSNLPKPDSYEITEDMVATLRAHTGGVSTYGISDRLVEKYMRTQQPVVTPQQENPFLR